MFPTRLLATQIIVALAMIHCGAIRPASEARAAESYAMGGAWSFSPFDSDYLRDPASGYRVSQFDPVLNQEVTSAFAVAHVPASEPTADAWGFGDAYGEVTADGIEKSVQADWGYASNGSYFAFARAYVFGTTFRLQAGRGQEGTDAEFQLVIPDVTTASPIRVTQNDVPFAIATLPQQLIVDDPLVAGIDDERALDLFLSMEQSVTVEPQGQSRTFQGTVTLAPGNQIQATGDLTNVFVLEDDPLRPSRSIATVRSSAVLGAADANGGIFTVPTDPVTGLSPPIIVDQSIYLSGVPFPGGAAADLGPLDPIDAFFDPESGPDPGFTITGFDNDAEPSGAAGAFSVRLNVLTDHTIVPEPSSILLMLSCFVAVVLNRRGRGGRHVSA